MPLFDSLTIVGAADDNFHNLNEVTSGADSDEILIWDVSEGGYRKIKRSNLIKNLSIYGLSLSDFLEFSEATAPFNPAVDKQRLYMLNTGILRIVDESGTTRDIVTTTDDQTLTNKHLTSPHITTPLIEDGDAGLTITSADQTHSSPTATVPDIGDSADEFVMKDVAQTLTQKTLDSPELDTPLVDGYIDFNEESAPAQPGASVGRMYYKSDHKFWYKDDLGVEREIGSGGSSGINSGGSSGINYCDNPDAETDTSGWSTYNDGASATPVDGTGGSPNITWTRSTSNPLRGTANFLLTKDAANRQGEGISYDFTIDRSDAASMLRISFDWESDVTLSEGDIVVYIYDKDNSALIQPVPYKLPSTVASHQNHWQCEFQTATLSANDYRLIIHVASTSATAWSIKFDNFSIGPNPFARGVPITDMVAFTPSGTWTSNVTYTGHWRRVGDWAYYHVHIECSGAPTATALYLNLPHTIDSSKINIMHFSTVYGHGNILDFGTMHYYAIVKPVGVTNQVGIAVSTKSGTYLQSTTEVTNTIPFSFGNGDIIDVYFGIPVLGWSSNCQVSSDAETRVVAAFVRRNTNLSLTGTTHNTFVCNDVIKDTHNAYNTSTGLYTCPVSGYYVVNASARTSSATWSVGHEIGFGIVKNSDAEIKISMKVYDSNVTSHSATAGISPPIWCNAGDTLKVQIYPSVNCTVDGSTFPNECYVGFDRLSGPAQIAASEKVVTIAYLNAAQNFNPNASFVKVNIDTTLKDTHGCLDASNHKWICPRAGQYHVDFGVSMSNTNVLNDRYFVSLHKNGSEHRRGTDSVPPANSYRILVGSCVVDLVAGDYLELYLYGAGNNSVNQLVADHTAPAGCYLHVHSI